MTSFHALSCEKIDKRVSHDDLLCMLQESVFGANLCVLAGFWAVSGSLFGTGMTLRNRTYNLNTVISLVLKGHGSEHSS